MAPALLSFPNPVNDVAARTVASGVAIMAVVAASTGALWMTIPLAYGFLARVLSGPRFSPLGRIATEFVAPRLPDRTKLVPGPPKRFAQGIGTAFSMCALGLWFAGESVPARIVLACLSIPALLEASLGYCVGCRMFSLLMRTGVIPAEICEECADIYSTKARERRAARSPQSA